MRPFITFWHFAFIGLCAWLVLFLGRSPVGAQTAPTSAPITQLTNTRATSLRPAWSPDQQLIAYQANPVGTAYHIYVMNADGTNPRALTQGSTDDRHPVWMPDGKTILFDSFDGAAREIWMVNLADGRRTQLTRIGALANFPAPSPDGQQITFYVFKDQTLDLWIARIDGSNAKPLTRELASAHNNQCTFACHRAAWSLDSRTIAFSAGELDAIWTIAREGGAPKPVIADGEDNHFPWFLPDGRLGYVVEHIDSASAWTDAWAFDLKTGERSLLQGRMSMQGPVEWSNDGKRVLFHSPRAGNFQIFLIDLNEPRGLEALHGTPVPAQQVRVAPRVESTSTPVAPTNNLDGTSTALAIGGIALAGLGGFFLWRKLRG